MQHEFQINNRTFLAVAVPENATDFSLTSHVDGLLFYASGKWHQIDFAPKTKWRLIGLYPGMSEEVAAGIVPCKNFADDEILYLKYAENGQVYASDFCDTATESLASKMLAEGLYLTNPFGETEPTKYDLPYSWTAGLEINIKAWQAAELRTSKVFVIIERLK